MLRAIIKYSIAAALAWSPSIAQSADWESYGPEPIGRGGAGRIISLAAHPTDASVLYAGAASGGVWKLSDGEWSSLTHHLPVASIGALALDPKSPETVYAGTGEPTYATHAFYGHGVYKSTDGGASWEVLAEKQFAGRTFARLIVHPTQTNILFAAIMHAGNDKGHPDANGEVGLFRSDDGAKTWSRIEAGLPDTTASDVEFSPDDPNIMYAAFASYGQQAGLYKSVDGGKTWNRIGANDLERTGKFKLAISPSNPKRIWLVSTSARIYRSDDAGASWSSHQAADLRIQGWYDIDCAVDPMAPDTAYFAGVNLVKTTDGGRNFSRVTPQHTDIQRLIFDASNRLISGDDGGVHRTNNGGRDWEELGAGISNIQIYAGLSTHPTNPYYFLAGLQDNGSVMRDSDSLSWAHVLGGDGGYTAVHPENPDIVFAEIYGAGAIYRSTNGGRSFNQSGSGINTNDRTCFLPPYVFHPSDSDVMYYATQRLYRSDNGGRNWSAISGDVTQGSGAIRSLSISPVDPNFIYAGTTDDQIVVSEDGGKTFEERLRDTPGYPRVARAISASTWDAKTAYKAVGAFDTDQVIVTRDAGMTWASLDGDLPNVPANAVEAFKLAGDDTELVLLGTDQGVYLNCDADDHWRKIGMLLPNVPVNDIRYDVHHQRIVAGTMGRGAWTHPQADAAFFRVLCMETGDEDDDETGSEDSGDSSDSSESDSTGDESDTDNSSETDDEESETTPSEHDSNNDESEKEDPSTEDSDDEDPSQTDSENPSAGGNDQPGGCGCTATSPRSSDGVAFLLSGFLLFGLRTRRRRMSKCFM